MNVRVGVIVAGTERTLIVQHTEIARNVRDAMKDDKKENTVKKTRILSST